VEVVWCSGRDLDPGRELSPKMVERLKCLPGYTTGALTVSGTVGDRNINASKTRIS